MGQVEKLQKRMAESVQPVHRKEIPKPYAVYKCGCGANPKILSANMVPERLVCLACGHTVLAKRMYPPGYGGP